MHSKTKYTWTFSQSLEAVGPVWDAIAPAANIFLQRPFLRILERNPPLGMRFGYLVFFAGEKPVGLAYCQIKRFKGDDNINESEHDPKNPCFFNVLGKWIKRWVAGKVYADILICGNMLLTGSHGFYFDPAVFHKAQFAELLEKALEDAIQILEKQGEKVPVILIKDIAPEEKELDNCLTGRGFVRFEIQPNMIFSNTFRDFEDYVGHMSKKYRTRTRRAFKKGGPILKKELSHAEILTEQSLIYRLYRQIATNSGFNMIDLNEEYLPSLKKDLGDRFRLFAYYIEEKLVAFYSIILNHEEMEAHFLGYEKSLNHDLQIYLNILYDLVNLGIESGKKEVVFARTALEIKSSVGAVAHNLYCYLRHQNGLTNKFTGTLLEYLKPTEIWTPRHPFGHAGENEDDDH